MGVIFFLEDIFIEDVFFNIVVFIWFLVLRECLFEF